METVDKVLGWRIQKLQISQLTLFLIYSTKLSLSRFLASLIVVLGEMDVSGDYEPKKTIQRNVRRVIVHKDFIARTFDNDLALLELESPVTFDEHIIPICLPTDYSETFVGKIGYVSGWGRLSYRKY